MIRKACAGALVTLLAWAAPAWAEDPREPVYVSAEQRDFVLSEMRDFLVAVQDIVWALAENDMAAVRETANAMGLGQGQGKGRRMGLNRVLPTEFRQMARGTHMAFSELAQTAERGPEEVLGDLGDLMSNCNGCHGVFKLVVKE